MEAEGKPGRKTTLRNGLVLCLEAIASLLEERWLRAVADSRAAILLTGQTGHRAIHIAIQSSVSSLWLLQMI